MEIILNLSDNEKKEILNSVEYIKRNLDFFVIRFYHYFLKTDTKYLFQNTEMNMQFNMFQKSINIMITHIGNPYVLYEHLESLITSHSSYGVLEEHVNYFIDSFMSALKEIFNLESQKNLLNLWMRLVHDIMQYFKKNI